MGSAATGTQGCWSAWKRITSLSLTISAPVAPLAAGDVPMSPSWIGTACRLSGSDMFHAVPSNVLSVFVRQYVGRSARTVNATTSGFSISRGRMSSIGLSEKPRAAP